MFCALSSISLSWKTLVFGPFTSQERTNFHRTAPPISHCLKYGENTLLIAAKSLEVTFPRLSRRGRHFANVDDVIIYPDLVVVRTEVSRQLKKTERQRAINTWEDSSEACVKMCRPRPSIQIKQKIHYFATLFWTLDLTSWPWST